MSKCTSVVVLVAVLSSLTLVPARANDLEKVLGALAVGYLAYQALDGARYEVAAPPNYAPPPAGYHGGDPCYWYQEGYSDGFRERAIWAPPAAYRDGDEALYWYREGHSDGVMDAEGFRRRGHVGGGVVIWNDRADRNDDRWGRAGGYGGPPPKARPRGYMPPPPGWQGGHAGPAPRSGRPGGYGPPPPSGRNGGYAGPPQDRRPGGYGPDQGGRGRGRENGPPSAGPRRDVERPSGSYNGPREPERRER